MQTWRTLGQQSLGHRSGVVDANRAYGGSVVLHLVQPGCQAGGKVSTRSTANRSICRTLVTGMISEMIGTSQPAATTRSRSRL